MQEKRLGQLLARVARLDGPRAVVEHHRLVQQHFFER